LPIVNLSGIVIQVNPEDQRKPMSETTDDSSIAQAARLVNGRGDPCDFGCGESDVQEMIAHVKKILPDRPYCAVRHWCWADVDIDPRQAEEVRQAGVKPAFVYANYIIDDESGRWNVGLSVRTTLLVELHKGCIFATRNTAYILVGPGTRMSVCPNVYNNLSF
jgi:hypothetical protein